MVKHADLWFSDGSVILNTDAVSFRVHRSILCKHSTIFSDMFELPGQPQHGAMGCPVINMPDSEKDLAYLLRAIFFSVDEGGTKAIKLDAACSILRLSTKYMLPSFRARAIKELEKYFPVTLEGFDKERGSGFTEASKLPYDTIIQTIGVARETRALGILPCALYQLCQYHLPDRPEIQKRIGLTNEEAEIFTRGREELCIAMSRSFFYSPTIAEGCLDPKRAPKLVEQDAPVFWAIRLAKVARCPG
ncbi:hypothetical protein HWV62_656 [Athelia sp. TMB]|nr:hypothetical protein HWV62_656 [Athelia sp. TMB]